MKLNSIGRGALILTMIFALVSVPVASATNNGGLNWDSDDAPEPYINEESVTIAQHDRAEMSSPLQYYDDNGDVEMLPAELNESVDNPIRYRADKVDAEILDKFPRNGEDNNSASAIDSSEWTKDASGSAGTGTISSTSTAGSVDAVQLSTSSQTSGDVMKFTYSNFTVDSDAEKRVAIVVGNVDSLDSGATVNVNFEESDGDIKSTTIDTAATASNADVIANQTANGVVYQAKLSELSTSGTGDGNFAAIDSVTVEVADANAQITLAGFDVEQKSKMNFGSYKSDTDADDELETVTVEQNADGGVIKLSNLSTLPSSFDSAVINDLEVHGLHYSASELQPDKVWTNFTDATNYPNFESQLDANFALEIPSAIDLSHSGLELRTEQSNVNERYIAFRYAEGVGDSEPSEVSSWTDASGSISSEGETLTLDNTIQPGESIMFNAELKLTGEQADVLQQQPSGIGGGPQSGGSSIIDSLFGLPGMILAGLAGILGLRRRS